MTVQEAIEKLIQAPRDAKLVTTVYVDSGCDTCGSFPEERDIDDFTWLEGTGTVEIDFDRRPY